jgi:hypothetical protein
MASLLPGAAAMLGVRTCGTLLTIGASDQMIEQRILRPSSCLMLFDGLFAPARPAAKPRR